MPTSYVNLSGSSSPGARSTRVHSAGKRGDTRTLKAGGGAAQRVRQKTARTRRSSDGTRKVAERTCVGCNQTGSAPELLRVVLDPTAGESSGLETSAKGSARVLIDLGGKLPGRGAWVHPQPQCIERACNRGFSKAFETLVRTTAAELGEQIRSAAERRLAGLLLASFRSRQLVYGRDAVKEVLDDAPLVIMARDAQAVAKDGDLQRAGFDGKVVWWSTKAQLGHWLGRSEVGVVAITEPSIAEAMRRAIALVSLAPGPVGPERAGEEQSSDVDAGVEDASGVANASELGAAVLDGGAVPGDGAVRDDEVSEVR